MASKATASFTDVNDVCGPIDVKGARLVDVSISGTWAGTIQLQRSFDNGTSWLVVESYTADAEKVSRNASSCQMRLLFETDTSGTAVVALIAGSKE